MHFLYLVVRNGCQVLVYRNTRTISVLQHSTEGKLTVRSSSSSMSLSAAFVVDRKLLPESEISSNPAGKPLSLRLRLCGTLGSRSAFRR